MIERVLLSFIAIVLLALAFRKRDKMSILITAGLTFGILFTWIGIPIVYMLGIIIYLLSTLLILYTNIRKNELSTYNRTTIIVSGVYAFGIKLSSILHWPYAEEFRLLAIIPIILFLISLFKGMIKRKEIGYLSILNVDFLMRLIH